MRKRIRLAGVAIVAGAVAALIPTGLSGALVRAQQSSFQVGGEVDGVYPGANAMLVARVTNPQPFTIRVRSLAVVVRDASPGCPGSMLRVGGPHTFVNVAPGATATVPLDVRMDHTAPDACQGATWPLEFVATATGVQGGTVPWTSAPAGAGSLAYTGARIAALLAIAVALIAVGVLALRAARRRPS